jgi:DNA-binding MarR family transcriptional regulator
MFNKLLGPSIYLILLDLFLENPDMLVNLREVARRVEKNPGSISRVMPRLVKEGFVEKIEVGKVMYAFRLNKKNGLVKLLIEFHQKLKDTYYKENGEKAKVKV